MSPKKRRSSRARCAGSTPAKYATPTFVPVGKGANAEIAAGNRIAERRLKAQKLAAYGQALKSMVKKKRQQALKKRLKKLRSVKKLVKRLAKEAA